MAKPTQVLKWTRDNANPVTVRTDPGDSKQLTGWLASERPSAKMMNWFFWVIGLWIDYLSTEVDAIKGLKGVTDAYVGLASNPLATHNSITAALAAVNPGARILILDSLTIDTIVQVTKNDVEIMMKPGVTLSKGAAATCFRLTGTGIRLKGGRIANFTTAVQVDATSTSAMIGEIRFANNTTDIDDAAGISTSWGLVAE